MGFQRYVNPPCLCSMKGVFLCILVGTLSASIYFITESFQERRASEVHLYDQAVESWTSSSRSQFAGLTVTVNNGSMVIPLAVDTTEDPLHDRTTGDLVPYVPLKYRMSTAIFGADLSWNATVGELSRELEFTVVDQLGQSSSFALPVKVYYTRISPTANQKNCHYQVHGAWRNAHCETYQSVQSLCVQVESTGQGWTSSGKGCHPKANWSPETYTTVPGSHLSFGHGEPPVGIIPSLNSVQLTIRSSADPYIDAMVRTNDSGNFGSTSKDQLMVGLILFGVSLFLSIPLVAHVYTVKNYGQDKLLEMVDREGEWSELNKLQSTRDNL